MSDTGNVCEFENLTSDTDLIRVRKSTDKGLENKSSLLLRNFRIKLSSWRKRANEIKQLLSEPNNSENLRNERKDLGTELNHISEIFSEYDNLLALHNKTNELNDRFEAVECDHRNLMKRISDYIRSDELDKDDLSSNSTRCSSKSRNTSASSKQSSKRIKAAADAAKMRAKLKYIDELERKKIEIKKIKTLENLEAVEGTLDAINKIEKEESILLDLHKDNSYTERFVREHTLTSHHSQDSDDDILVEKTHSQDVNEMSQIVKTFTQHCQLDRLPPPEPSIFF